MFSKEVCDAINRLRSQNLSQISIPELEPEPRKIAPVTVPEPREIALAIEPEPTEIALAMTSELIEIALAWIL